MISRVSRTIVSQPITAEGSITQPTPLNQHKWKAELYHKSGGLKSTWYIGTDDCPINLLEFETNLHGNGAGTIGMAYLDFPIDPTDYFRIYYDDTNIYTGVVDVAPDPKGGEITLIGRHQYLADLLINSVYTSKTAAYIFQNIIEAKDSQTGIYWNAALVNTGSTETFTITYNYEEINKSFDGLISRLDDRFWGVTPTGFFYVSQFSSAVDTTLFYTDQPGYSSVDVEYDYSGIDATRYQIFKKTVGSGETVRIGQVGYAAPYPPLDIEKTTRVIEKNLTISEVLTDSQAFEYAYAKLTAQDAKTTITVNDIDLEKYVPVIGNKINIQDRENMIMLEIVNCDSITGWNGATLDSVNYVSGTGSVKFTATNINDEMEYSFAGQTIWKNPSKIGFMLMAAEAGSYISFEISYGTTYNQYGYGSGEYSENAYGEGDDDGEETTETTFTNTINVTAANVWNFYSFESTLPISRIRFYANSAPTGASIINVDRIQLYCNYRTQYEANIVQANYSITPKGDNVSMKLNTYDKYSNDAIFRYERLINTLEIALRSS